MFTPAYAQSAAPAGGSDLIIQLVPFLLIFVIMYFLILRPQQRRAREHQDMMKSIRRNDTVVTAGGIIGKVTKVVDESNELEVEIADNVRVRVLRSTVSEVRAKAEPVKAA